MCFCERQTKTGSSDQGGQGRDDARTRDWKRSTVRDESGARSQRDVNLFPDQYMFAQDGTGNFKYGGCSGDGYRYGLRTVGDRKKNNKLVS